jgi:hypothetical protein
VEVSYRGWLGEKWGERCIQALKNHGFDAHFVPSAEEAKRLILERISGYGSFGFAGSGTTRALGLPEALKAMGKTLYDHWQGNPVGEESHGIRLGQGRCDCFLCSANAVSATGEIVNVDGVGNRTTAMTFGPRKIVIVAGMNKVRPDLESALRRVKEVAAPMRARSLNLDTPCAATGVCSDCNSPQRVCRVTTILHRKPMMSDITVVLINENLGF